MPQLKAYPVEIIDAPGAPENVAGLKAGNDCDRAGGNATKPTTPTAKTRRKNNGRRGPDIKRTTNQAFQMPTSIRVGSVLNEHSPCRQMGKGSANCQHLNTTSLT